MSKESTVSDASLDKLMQVAMISILARFLNYKTGALNFNHGDKICLGWEWGWGN